MNYTVSLSSRGDSVNVSKLGGKGFSLVVLSQGGFKVPHAFIVSDEAFREFRNELDFSFTEIESGFTDDKDIERIVRLIDEHGFKYELEAEIQTQLHDLVYSSPIPNPLLAVRSSGVLDDMDYARVTNVGKTVLNVKCDLTSVCVAIRDCWKSFFSRESIDWRIEHEFSALNASVAIVIQIMIPADVSGVAFTVDPQTGSRAHISLDGIQGLGEAFVNGIVNTDHWIIRKPYGDRDYKIEERHIGIQNIKLMSNYPKAGTKQVVLNEEERKKPCFSDNEINMIMRMVIEIEKYYQQPMNIEFCMYLGTLYIVQARQINSLLSIPNSINPLIHPYNDEWSLFINISSFSLFSNPISPAGSSFLKHISNLSEQYLVNINGSMFVNIASLMSTNLTRETYDILTDLYETEYSIFSHKQAKHANKAISNTLLYPLLWRIWKQKLVKPSELELKSQIESGIKEGLAVADNLQIIIRNNSTDIQLLSILSAPYPKTEFVLTLFNAFHYSFQRQDMIKSILKQAGIDEKEAESLWANQSISIRHQVNQCLRSLNQAMHKLSFTTPTSSSDDSILLSWLDSINTSSDSHSHHFSQLWSSFIDQYGCLGPHSTDLTSPRWSEKPVLLLRQLLDLTDIDIDTDIERRKTITQISSRLSESDRHRVISLLPYANLAAGYTDHIIFMYSKLTSILRSVLLQLGKRMKREGVIDDNEDIFFLQLAELLWWEQGRSQGHDFKDKIKISKEIYKSKSMNLIARVIQGPECVMRSMKRSMIEPLSMLPSSVIKGRATSPGIVEGRAVVVHDMMSIDNMIDILNKNDILVIKTTNHQWTDILKQVVGVVLEVGGPLNHGSVVSRMLGIPCVVGINEGINYLQTGMIIQVNGQTGIITILENNTHVSLCVD